MNFTTNIKNADVKRLISLPQTFCATYANELQLCRITAKFEPSKMTVNTGRTRGKRKARNVFIASLSSPRDVIWKRRINVTHREVAFFECVRLTCFFCAFHVRFSVSFLCQSAEITMVDATHCVIQNEYETFRIIITRPRPVLAVCFVYTYVSHVEILPTHTRDLRKRGPAVPVLSTMGGQRRRVCHRIRKPRDISLHRNRGIIDRQVCSARQIDGRGENDDRVETRELERQR